MEQPTDQILVDHRAISAEIAPLIDQTLTLGRRLAAQPANPLEHELATVQAQLEFHPHSTDLLFFQARLLERLGRTAAARTHYLALLDLDPAHIASLNNLGNLLLTTHTAADTEQARQAFLRAVAADPNHLASRANLGNLLIKQGELSAACDHLRAALAVAPTYRPAHASLSFILGDLGDPAAASQHRQRAFADRAVVVAAYRGSEPPIIVLELVSTTGGNMRTDEYLSDRAFQRILVAAEFYTPGTVLPPHHLVLNAVGDADAAPAALAGALAVVADSHAPVLNPPAAVLGTGRCAIAQRLAGIPGVRTAKTVLLPDSPTDLPSVLAALPGAALLALEYLDARRPDGLSRKYRVMLVDGRLYPSTPPSPRTGRSTTSAPTWPTPP